MSNIGPMLEQVLLRMQEEILTSDNKEIAWLEMMYDVIDFGDAVNEMTDAFEIGEKKKDPDDSTSQILRGLFNSGEEDNE